jgi:hypothetical protein
MAARHGRLRRKMFLGGLVAVCALAGTAAVLSTSAGAVTSHTNYVLWGENGVHIGNDSIVTGLVGARNNRTEYPNPHSSITMAGGSKIIGDARAGAKVKMLNVTEITGTVYHQNNAAGAFVYTSTSKFGVDAPGTLASVDLPVGAIPRKWPLLYANAYCGRTDLPNIDRGAGTTINLAPGQYGRIKAGSTTTLNFTGAGNYFMQSLSVGSVKLNITPGVNIFVCDKFSTLAITNKPAATLKPSDVYVEVAAIREDADHHGFEVTNGEWVGDVVVPTAGIHYGSGGSGNAKMTGRFWAEHIDLEHAIKVQDGPRPTPTTTTSTTKPAPPTTGTTSTTTTTPTIPTTTTSTTSTTTSTTTTTTTTTVPPPTTTSTFRT